MHEMQIFNVGFIQPKANNHMTFLMAKIDCF